MASAIHTCRIGNETVTIPTSAPRFVIIGAMKAGTSSLFRYLLDHPDAVPTLNWSTKNSTEIHFFDLKFPWAARKRFDSDDDFHCHVRKVYAQTQYDYPTLLADATNGTGASSRLFSFDKTPKYITDAGRLPRLLRQVLPWMDRVVVSLRNPVDRAYSQFNFENRRLGSSLADAFHVRVKEEIVFMAHAGLINITSAFPDEAASLPSEDFSGLYWESLPERAREAATFLGHDNKSWDEGKDIPLYKEADLDSEQLSAIALLGVQDYVPGYYFAKVQQEKENGADSSPKFHWNSLDAFQEAAAFTKIRTAYLGRGLYAIQLRQWLEQYPIGNFFVANFDELDRTEGSARNVFVKLLHFLGLREYDVSDALFRKHNAFEYVVPMHNTTRRILQELYRSQNQRLESVLGKEWKCIWECCK